MSDPSGSSQNWIKREVSLGNVLLLLGTLGAIAAGIYEGGAIRSSLADSVTQETAIRVAENKALNDRLDVFGQSIENVRGDVRELRSYVMVKSQFPVEHR